MESESNERAPLSPIACYRRGWEVLRSHPGRLLLLLLVLVILQLPTNLSAGTGARFFGVLYQIFVVPPIGFGFAWVLLMNIRDQESDLGDLFILFRKNYLNAVGAGVVLPLVFLISALPAIGATLLATLREQSNPLLIAVACAFLIIPFFASIRLGFVPYLLVEREMGPLEVLSESWNRTEPVQAQLVVVTLLAIPVLTIGLALLLVGIFPAVLLFSLAHAAVFDVSQKLVDENESNDSD